MNYTTPKTPNPDDGVAEVNEPAVAYGVARTGGDADEYGTMMKTAAAPRSRRTIDLGNGVMFPVESAEEADFVEWMVGEAKAGRGVTLPKKAPSPTKRPIWFDTEPQMSSEEFWAIYKDERADR